MEWMHKQAQDAEALDGRTDLMAGYPSPPHMHAHVRAVGVHMDDAGVGADLGSGDDAALEIGADDNQPITDNEHSTDQEGGSDREPSPQHGPNPAPRYR